MTYKDIAAKTALMSGLIQNGRIDEASQVFSQLGKRDAICWNSMIAGYCQSGRMGEALNLFRQMPVKNAVSWNTMISGYAQSGQMDRAAEIFEAMLRSSLVEWLTVLALKIKWEWLLPCGSELLGNHSESDDVVWCGGCDSTTIMQIILSPHVSKGSLKKAQRWKLRCKTSCLSHCHVHGSSSSKNKKAQKY
ncbi:hypothetical protein TSUD_234920 [Trifolium subterraneum]|uniref:Pentatricopeptide repeat-containing protein n=1 Tax=Trifolium subterraneum TaxID=3900 RepID=A0A2Z6MH47_TRISU|nr:hypothetical protein TSUD_234920 [Trifolium subterraneum]